MPEAHAAYKDATVERNRRWAKRIGPNVAQTSEQTNIRTCIIQHVLRRTMCKCSLRKLLNCKRSAGVEKTCRVIDDLHTCYTRTMMYR